MTARILCVMRMPPNPSGHGGSQRAAHLLNALLPHGEVHFVLLYRSQDYDCVHTSLEPIEGLVASVTRINIAGWQGSLGKRWGFIPGKLWDLVKMGSQEAPRLSRRELKQVADSLPAVSFDLIFAGRVCTAVIVQAMLDQGLIACDAKVVDFDDVMSKFRLRQVRNARNMNFNRRMAARVDAAIIAKAEAHVATSWNGLSVCTDEDILILKEKFPRARVVKVPNVIDKDLLPARIDDGTVRLLFAGNLGFSANTDGLVSFVEECWSLLAATVPNISLTVVGLNPSPEVVALTKRYGFALHSNVPSLQPFYEDCDVVIAPILFGSGTRIKILEAMAYGRPVVSTSMGAEGLGLQHGKHVLLADDMQRFGECVVQLAGDRSLQERLAVAARAYQQSRYTPQAIHSSVAELVQP